MPFKIGDRVRILYSDAAPSDEEVCITAAGTPVAIPSNSLSQVTPWDVSHAFWYVRDSYDQGFYAFVKHKVSVGEQVYVYSIPGWKELHGKKFSVIQVYPDGSIAISFKGITLKVNDYRPTRLEPMEVEPPADLMEDTLSKGAVMQALINSFGVDEVTTNPLIATLTGSLNINLKDHVTITSTVEVTLKIQENVMFEKGVDFMDKQAVIEALTKKLTNLNEEDARQLVSEALTNFNPA